MAVQTMADWIPDEFGGAIVSKVNATSALERVARREPMLTDVKNVPRSAGMTLTAALAKSGTYGEATGTNDDVTLTARKLGAVVRLADEDIKDEKTAEGVINVKMGEWGRAVAIQLDHAALGVSAVADGTTKPYNSLFYAINTTNAETGYTGDDNLIQTAGSLTYAHLSDAFQKIETSDFYDEGRLVVIAHPAFKSYLRNLTGTLTYFDGSVAATASDGRPVFEEHSALGTGAPDRIFGAPVYWTLGARAHATSTSAPTGNHLFFVGNPDLLILGDRSPYEYMVAGADSGPAFLTDEALLKMRVRRGFAVANELGWACIEKTSS